VIWTFKKQEIAGASLLPEDLNLCQNALSTAQFPAFLQHHEPKKNTKASKSNPYSPVN